MAIATLRAKLVADTSQFTGALKRARSALSNVGKTARGSFLSALSPMKLMSKGLSSIGGHLSRIIDIAAGIMLQQIFQKAVTAISNFGKAIFRAVERMQTLRIQIGTLTARELSKSINASIDQSIAWRGMTKDGEMLRINIADLREGVKGYEDVLRSANPALGALLDSQEKWGTVSAENAGVWVSTADAFEAAIPLTKDMMNELARIAIISPFTIDATNNMFRMASAMGFTGKQALDITGGMLNVAAGLGLTNEQAQRLVLNFSQIRSQGKMTQRDIREMTLTGFQMNDMFEEMNRQLGTNIHTNTDFNKALEQGKFTWAEFTSSFASLADRQFGESAKRMAVTIQGIKSSISDIVTISSDRVFGPAADEMGKVFEKVLDKFADIISGGQLDAIGEQLRVKVAGGVEVIENVMKRVSALGGGIKEMFWGILYGLGDAGIISEDWYINLKKVHAKYIEIKNTVNGLKTKLSEVTARAGDIVGAKMGATRGVESDGMELSGPLEIMLGGAMDILAPIAVWWTDTFAPVVEDVITRLEGPVMTFITGFVEGFTDTPIPGLFEAITTAISKVDSNTLEKVGDAIVTIATVLADNAETIGRVVSTFLILAGLASAIATIAGAVGTMVAAFGAAGGVMGILAAILAFIGGPITIAIALAALALVAWQENWGGIQEKVASVIDTIKTKFDEMKAKFEEIKNKLVAAWTEHIKPIWDGLIEVVAAAALVVQDIVDIFVLLWDIIKEVAGAIFDKLSPYINDFIDGVVEGLTPIVEAFQAMWEVIGEKLAPVFEELKTVVGEFVTDKLNSLKRGLGFVKTVLDGVHSLFMSLKEGLSNFELPAWLESNSPPQLAYALGYIAEGLEAANSGFSTMRRNMSGMAFGDMAGDAALTVMGGSTAANTGGGQDPMLAKMDMMIAEIRRQGTAREGAQALAEAIQLNL